MKKSKILSLVLAVAMVIACFAGSISTVSAETDFTLTVGTVDATPGSTVNIPFVLTNNPGVCAFYISMEYDQEFLELKGHVDGGVLSSPIHSGTLEWYPFNMTWDDALVANTNNGTLVTVEFYVSENAQPGDFLNVDVYAMFNGDGAILDFDMNDLEINFVNGGVNVVAPATEAPATEAPATEAPATEAPATEAPATEAPATEAPATEAPATEAPATEAPATEAPATEAPATEAPATEAPATEAPATEAPATEAPATEAPATEAPATEAPAEDNNANTGDSFAVFAAIAVAIVMLGAVVVIRRKKA